MTAFAFVAVVVKICIEKTVAVNLIVRSISLTFGLIFVMFI